MRDDADGVQKAVPKRAGFGALHAMLDSHLTAASLA